MEVYKDRRCSSCTAKDQKRFGCEEDITKFYFDKEYHTRCPLRPFKEDPAFFSELFKLYSFREKGFMAEEGGYYDQPNFYIEAMTEMDGAISDSYTIKDDMKAEEDKKTQALAQMGVAFTPKR